MDKFALIFIGIIIYVIILFLLKNIGIWKKIKSRNCNNCCPLCSAPLIRIKRKKIDHIIIYLTFRFFDFKRYKCSEKKWEGLRWEENEKF